jgi:hypothetical protein
MAAMVYMVQVEALQSGRLGVLVSRVRVSIREVSAYVGPACLTDILGALFWVG